MYVIFSLTKDTLIFEVVFDVIVGSKKIFVVDFSEWSESTDSCLFDWDDLNLTNTPENNPIPTTSSSSPFPSPPSFSSQNFPIFLFIESETGIQPNESLASRVPFDLKDYSDEGALKQYLENMSLDQMKKMAQDDDE